MEWESVVLFSSLSQLLEHLSVSQHLWFLPLLAFTLLCSTVSEQPSVLFTLNKSIQKHMPSCCCVHMYILTRELRMLIAMRWAVSVFWSQQHSWTWQTWQLSALGFWPVQYNHNYPQWEHGTPLKVGCGYWLGHRGWVLNSLWPLASAWKDWACCVWLTFHIKSVREDSRLTAQTVMPQHSKLHMQTLNKAGCKKMITAALSPIFCPVDRSACVCKEQCKE